MSASARSPAATSCLELLQDYFSNEGRCEETEQVTRRLIAIEPQNPDWHFRLANDLFVAGADQGAVALALELGYTYMTSGSRRAAEYSHAFSFAVLRGDTIAAEAAVRNWLMVIDSSPNDDDHVLPTLALMNLLIQTNRRTEALAAGNAYLRKTRGWFHSNFDYDESFFVVSLAHAVHGIAEPKFVHLRDAWLEREVNQADKEMPVLWTIAYAQTAENVALADEALRALPKFGMPDPLTRLPKRDYAIGKTFVLGGKREEGLTYLRRAANACSVVESPFTRELSEQQLALAAESIRDRTEACKWYRKVAQAWGATKSTFEAGRSANASLTRLNCSQ